MKEKIAASMLEDIVAKEIKIYTEDFLEKEQTRNIEYKVQNSICESLLERKDKLEVDKEKLQVCKMQFYEQYKQDIIDREAYLFQKEGLSNQLQNIEQEVFIIENKIKENTALGHNLNVDKLKEAVLNRKFVPEWINEVIEKIYVYDKDMVEIVWKFDC